MTEMCKEKVIWFLNTLLPETDLISVMNPFVLQRKRVLQEAFCFISSLNAIHLMNLAVQETFRIETHIQILHQKREKTLRLHQTDISPNDLFRRRAKELSDKGLQGISEKGFPWWCRG